MAHAARADARAGADEPKKTRADHVRVGALAGVGFPHPFSVEATIKLERVVSLGAEYGFSPDITVSGVTGSLWSASGVARVFPLRGPFFLGLHVGYQHLGASAAAYGQSLAVDGWFANPRIGMLWTWRSGFSIGFDAGVQIPLTSSISGTPRAMSIPQLHDAASVIGGTVLPTIDLLRMGFLL